MFHAWTLTLKPSKPSVSLSHPSSRLFCALLGTLYSSSPCTLMPFLGHCEKHGAMDPIRGEEGEVSTLTAEQLKGRVEGENKILQRAGQLEPKWRYIQNKGRADNTRIPVHVRSAQQRGHFQPIGQACCSGGLKFRGRMLGRQTCQRCD